MEQISPTVKYTLWGIAFGFCFPISAILIDTVLQGADVTLDNLLRVQAGQPLHWIIDTAPFFLGLLSYFIGRSQKKVIYLNNALKQKLDVRTTELETANEELRTKVAEQRKTEEFLRHSEEKLAKITSSAQDAIIMMDSEGKVTFWNHAAERIFRYTAEEIIGQSLHNTLAPQSFHAAHDKGFARFRETGEGAAVDQTIELTGLRKDDSEFPLELSLSAVQLDGQWHAVGVLRDITERKEAEEELLSARQEAEEANRAKSIFLANMSHEIRTPMNAIIGFADLLGKTELTPTQQEYAKTVQTSSHALLELINDILDFSKIEAGKLEMEQVGFCLRDVLDETADMFREKVADSAVELVIDVGENVPEGLVGDPLRLRQVLVNLVGNAVKFTAEGEIVLNVECREASATEATLSFAVRDTGPGIPQDKINDLFSAFTQADGSTTRKYGGSGLGLAVCKQLVELMGGRIGVESEVGKGSTFHFTAVFGQSTAETGSASLLLADLKDLRVLIVDDNASSRTVMEHMVESFGWQGETASSGMEALAALCEGIAAEHPFDLVLMDWRMPEMDGIEVCKRIRMDSQLKKMRIIMMTAFGQETEKTRAGELSLDAFLIKPIKPSLLFDTVASIWGRETTVEADEKSSMMITHEKPDNPFTGRRVLLAEDNAINRKLAVILLEKAGFSVDAVENGRLAVKAVQDQSYDAVLMDVQMPEMDGYDATRAIRAEPEFCDLPIIAMTAGTMEGDKDKCLEVGMNDYARKPIDSRELFATLKKWIAPLKGGLTATPSVEPVKDEGVGVLPTLVGIDVAEALERMSGNEGLLRELLVDFKEEFGNATTEIREALAQEDRELARRLVHTLKGTSGNLSAHDLQEATLALETAIREGEEDINKLIDRVERVLTQVLGGIDMLDQERGEYQAEESGGDDQAPNERVLTPLIEELGRSIQDCDPVKVDAGIEELRRQTGGVDLREEIHRLAEQAGNFDFNEARKTWVEIAGKLEIPI